MQMQFIWMAMGLGAVLALIFALIAARVGWLVWRGLSERESSRPRPETEARLMAERDSLRVENAMLTHRLGVREQALKEQLREAQAEAARMKGRLAEIEARIRA